MNKYDIARKYLGEATNKKNQKLLQVKQDGEWKWVFAMNKDDNKVVTTDKWEKALQDRDLDTFKKTFGNDTFRVIKPMDINEAKSVGDGDVGGTAYVDITATDVDSPDLKKALKKYGVKMKVTRVAKGGRLDQEDSVRLTATTPKNGDHPFEALRDLLADQWGLDAKEILDVYNETQKKNKTGKELGESTEQLDEGMEQFRHDKKGKAFWIGVTKYPYFIEEMHWKNDPKAYHIEIDQKSFSTLSKSIEKMKNVNAMISHFMGSYRLSIDVKSTDEQIYAILYGWNVKPK